MPETRRKKLSKAQLQQRRENASKGGRARAEKAALAAAEERARLQPFTDELAYFNGKYSGAIESWRERCQAEDEYNFDPLGFYEELLTGEYEVNAETLGGAGPVGIMRFQQLHVQRLWNREIIWHRWAATDDVGWARYQEEFPEDAEKFGRPRGRFMRIVLKGRRAYFTTNNVVRIVAEGTANAGSNAACTSFDVKEGLKTLGQLLRITFGDSKNAAPGAKVMNEQDFKTSNRSMVRLLTPGSPNMGKGYSYTNMLWTEAGYASGMEASLTSVMPSVRKFPFACVVFESTVDRNSDAELLEMVRASLKGKTAFRVYFQPWWWDTTARAEVTPADKKALDAREPVWGSGGYEFETLRDDLGLSDEQIVWWRQRFLEDAGSDLSVMMEQYPAKVEEILDSGSRGEFLYQDSLDWIETTCRDPEWRMKVTPQGLVELDDPRDYGAVPHAEIWTRPEWGSEYAIGGDIADEEERSIESGSENYALVVNLRTGEQCAEWCGDATAPEFALVLYQLARWYNNALIIPEANRGMGVIRKLSDAFEYQNIYRRENVSGDVVTVGNQLGFYTSRSTRPVLVANIQDVVNGCKVLIRSKRLHGQLKAFAKRRGQPQKQQSRGKEKDDGCIALGLTTFGHDGLDEWRSWRKHEDPRPKVVVERDEERPVRGYRIEDDDEEDIDALRHGMQRS